MSCNRGAWRQVAEVFIVIDQATWRRGVALFLLVVAAGVFYMISKVQESSGGAGGELVFRPPVTVSELAAGSAFEGSVPDEPALDVAAGEVALGRVEEEALAVLGNEVRFDAFRIERSQGRSQRIEALEESLKDEGLPSSVREEMRRELLALVEQAELEREIEGLLVARGLSDAVVVLKAKAAEVVVSDVLDRNEAAQVGDLVARLGGVPLEGIVIVDGAATP